MRIPQIILVTLSLFFPGATNAQDKPQDRIQKAHSFKRQVKRTVRTDYLLFLPRGYDAGSAKRWPLILYLHGAGERGTDPWRAGIHGPARYAADHPDFPFILVSPLCPLNETWDNDTLVALLNEITRKHKVDPERVYLTGLSMGGFGAWNLALEHPGRFAAVVPICGGGDSLPLVLGRTGYLSAERKDAIKSLPVWAFHGARDTVVPRSESERLTELLRGLGAAEVKLTIYPDAQHDSWTETYSNPEVYRWLLEHKRER